MTSILAIVFGNMCQFQPDDSKLHEGFLLTERIATIFGPLEQMAEFFPFLKYILPKQKEKYAQVKKDLMDFYGGLLTDFKHILEKNQDMVDDCFMKEIMQKGELTDLQMVNFVALFIGAGKYIYIYI